MPYPLRALHHGLPFHPLGSWAITGAAEVKPFGLGLTKSQSETSTVSDLNHFDKSFDNNDRKAVFGCIGNDIAGVDWIPDR